RGHRCPRGLPGRPPCLLTSRPLANYGRRCEAGVIPWWGGVHTMRTRAAEGRSVFAALVVYLVLVDTVDAATSDLVIRLAPLATLAPIGASALLGFRRTAVVCALYLGLTIGLYGLWLPHISVPNRAAVIGSAVAVALVSLVVCRVRLVREERTKRLRLTAG